MAMTTWSLTTKRPGPLCWVFGSCFDILVLCTGLTCIPFGHRTGQHLVSQVSGQGSSHNSQYAVLLLLVQSFLHPELPFNLQRETNCGSRSPLRVCS